MMKMQEKKADPIAHYIVANDDGAQKVGKPKLTNLQIFRHLMLEPLNALFVFAPIGMYVGITGKLGPSLCFTFCFIALVPLAKLLGDATEHLAENLNQTIGGLLNATFGNAVEMIITVSAIRNGLLDLVKKSLLGSILSNMLLVLGMSFFAGGLTRSEQHFGGTAALINVTMLFVGMMAFSLPTVFAFNGHVQESVLAISRVSSICVGVGYVAYLVFQLYTHVEIFEDVPQLDEKEAARIEGGEIQEEEEEEEDSAVLSVPWALGLLFISTILVWMLSEFMIASIEGLVVDWNIPQAFVGVILLPIVGNACEHASAVRMAYNNKVATAIAIAVGSSTQIALLVMPFAVIYGWIVDEPLDFNVDPTGLAVLYSSVFIVFSIVMDGSTNWLEGFMLMLAYCLVAILFWYMPNVDKDGHMISIKNATSS